MIGEASGLRVLMVTPRYFPYVGGIETHVHEVGCRLACSGIDITFLTTSPHAPHAPLPREEVIEGMHIIRVPAWPPRRDYYLAPEIFSVIQSGNWDLVHCQGCHTFVPPLAMIAARKAKIPYVVTFHTGGHSSRLRTHIRGMQWRLLRSLFAGAAQLIAVSRFEVDYFRNLLSLPAQRFSIIPNGSSIGNGTQLPEGRRASSLIVSVGRLERYKGHQRLLAALPKIRERRPTARLLIVGAGPYKAALQRLAQKIGVSEYVEIRSIPASDRQTMAETLSQAAVVALLSEYEAHPIAVMEALALRCPVVVANTSGMQELAEQRLVRAVPLQSTAEQVAAAVLQQMEEPLMPKPLSLPTWEGCAQKLINVYRMSGGRGQCAS